MSTSSSSSSSKSSSALGEEIADENGRSVVKIVHQPVNPRELADDSDSDDEFSRS
jgi:dihydroxyacid dehydratase/phosphogluconate dehydratase